jgi:hypothetical protein
MPKKLYYRATGLKTFDWVDSPNEATQAQIEAAEVTQKHFSGTELIEIRRDSLPSVWILAKNAWSAEEKMERFRKVAAGLREKATGVGLTGPFISWVTDPQAGTLMLEAPAVSDTSGLRPIAWDSNRFVVTLFDEARKYPVSSVIDF